MQIIRFDALTGFRAFAASLVFVYHNRKYWRAHLHPEVLRFFNEMHIGVSLFFVLSGFLLAYTYGEKPLNSISQYRKYILTRFARIFPLYWLILTAFYLDPKFKDVGHYFHTYSLFHGLSNKLNLEGIAQAWSLSVEFTFYLLLPLLVILERKHILVLVLFLVGLFLVTVGIGFGWTAWNGNPQQFLYPTKFVIGSTFAGRSSEFFAGMFLARILRNQNNQYSNFWEFKHKTLVGFLGVFLTAYVIGCFQPDIYHHGTDHPIGLLLHILVLPLFVLFLLAGLINEATYIQRVLSTKIMVLLGKASFAFYLIHISYVNIRLRWIWIGPDRNFILLWLISIALFLLFENPIYTWIRKKMNS